MATDGKQCAHIWAQQTKASGQGYGAIRFDGDTLYSYREPIARIVKNARGTAALLRDATFSVTTSTHQSYARGAVSHMRSFTVSDIHAPKSEDVREAYAAKLEKMALDIARMRSDPQWRLEHARRLEKEANDCAAFFDWQWRLALPEISKEHLAKLRADALAKSKKERLQREERERAAALVLAGEVDAWLAGRQRSIPYGYTGDTLLRIIGDEIQTSRGARIPVAHARRLWPVILQHKAAGTRYQRNGHTIHVGEFHVDSIEADGTLIAGCHTIEFAQIERIAKELGLA